MGKAPTPLDLNQGLPSWALTGLACPTCGGELIRKSRLRLILTGIVMAILAIAMIRLSKIVWILALPVALSALYLLEWGIKKDGLWCRQCKQVPRNVK